MELDHQIYQTYVQILKSELIPAFGCTEPIAIAYCAAKAREILGDLPEKVHIKASGNIIKNAKSVIIPNTDGLKGIPAAAVAGIIGGKVEKKLEVISELTQGQKNEMRTYLENTPIEVKPLKSGDKLDILITVYAKDNQATVRISKNHSNIVHIEKNGQVYECEKDSCEEEKQEVKIDKSLLNIADIVQFASEVNIEDVQEVLEQQINYNYAVAKEGMAHNWGANIGSIMVKTSGNDVQIMSKALAAAGADARMDGCELPVVVNSGSGSQGITVSVPVIVYAEHLKSSRDQLYRGLVISNLIALHIKHGIGALSAFCGAASAGCAAGCGIAYLHGGGEKEIAHTLVNALAIVSGIFCDGAKASCAAKIAVSVEAGILGYSMYQNGEQFYAGDGIVSTGVEKTIQNICRLGAEAMNETDEAIIQMMTHCD